MSITNLARRLDILLERIEKRQVTLSSTRWGLAINHMALFSEQEQAEIQALIDTIEPRVTFFPSGMPDLSQLTNQELDQLETWLIQAETLAAKSLDNG